MRTFRHGLSCIAAATMTACGGASMQSDTVVPAMQEAPADGSPEYAASVKRDIARVRATTEAFHSIDAAAAAGYPRTVQRCLAHPQEGGMGFHHINRALLDDRLEVERPEILLYERTADGGYALIGVEYIVPYSARSRDAEPPEIMDRPLKRADGLELWYLHVWAWKENGSGVFNDWNPAVECRTGGNARIPFPEGYRDWTHVKSSLISPSHPNFAVSGGYRHVYANVEAMAGYRTRVFPEGSVIVFDRIEMQDRNGAFVEGPRSGVDIMMKDSARFAATGGWGFQRFIADSRTELADTPKPEQCFACHERLGTDDLVISTYRP